MKIAGLGGLIGAVVALPMLLWLAALAAPILGAPAFAMADLAQGGLRVFAPLPLTLWVGLPALPLIAAAIGWLTASITVRRWLQNLL
jgi:cell division transport system permease protein